MKKIKKTPADNERNSMFPSKKKLLKIIFSINFIQAVFVIHLIKLLISHYGKNSMYHFVSYIIQDKPIIFPLP